ncbi:MAG: S41 family peptidase [Anaerostipes sp.]|nr:S41 family peptidase [Anaerostipes sp.]
MKKNLSKIIITVLLVISMVEGAFLVRAYVIPSNVMKVARKINSIEKLIDSEYTGGKVDKEKIEDYAYKGMVAGLGDVYSGYYNKSEFEEMMSETDGIFSGVGLQMLQNSKTGEISVVKVMKDTPAQKKGVGKGDILLKVENKSVKNQNLSDIVQKIRGEKGTKVHLTLSHNTKEYQVTLTRAVIETPTIESKMLEGKIGYIQIIEFDEVTVNQFKSALSSLKKKGMKSLILDVRDNPGGLLESVTKVANEIQSGGVIVSTKDKKGKEKVYNASKDAYVDIPICLLVNENSASASEILAGTLKDHKLATLVGEKTFGKGIVQGFYSAGNGSYLKLTSAKYYTPNGNNIHKKGINPNVVVKDNKKTSKDEQLEKAKEILK